MPKAATLLLIEDDPFMVEWIRKICAEDLGELEISIISSEREFLLRQEELANTPLKGIILDVMLPWEDGAEIDVEGFSQPRGEYFQAGMRILQDLEANPKFGSLPVLIHTVNDRSAVELPRTNKIQLTFMRKDEPDHKLLHWIARLK